MLSREKFVSAPPDTSGDSVQESNLEAAYQRLRNAIIKQEFKPGAVISQVRLAKQLGVSRTPLREAMRLLERDGLLVSEHNRRVRIAEMSTADMEELYALRLSIEPVALRVSVPRLTSDDYGRLRQLLNEMEVLMRKEDVDAWEKAHSEFHLLLVRHAGKRSLKLISELSDHAERYRRLFISQGATRWSAGAEDHRTILKHCEKGDAAAAAVSLAHHYARTSLSLLLAHDPTYEPATIRSALRMVIGEPVP